MLERNDKNEEKAYLVEFNTIASGAGALCAGVTQMHRQLNLRNFDLLDFEAFQYKYWKFRGLEIEF